MRVARCLLGVVFLGSIAACAAPAGGEPALLESEQIRALTPQEILGFVGYGESTSVAYTSTPTYRALQFRVNAFDRYKVTVTPASPGATPWAALLDESGKEIVQKTGTAGSPLDLSDVAEARFVQRTIVVRDANLANATFSVVVASSGIAEPAVPFTATPGSYKADAAFANKSVDVSMRCLSRRFDWEKKTTESTSVAVVSLRFDATGKVAVAGADGALQTLGRTTLSRDTEAGNAVWLSDEGKSRYNVHYVQATNQAANRIRVEAAIQTRFGNTGGVATQLSCVGIAMP